MSIAAYCGQVALRPCDCVRQCQDYLCHADGKNGKGCDTLSDLREDRPCFEWLPTRKKNITETPAKETKDVQYYSGIDMLKREEMPYE